jgi:hypothetical protein
MTDRSKSYIVAHHHGASIACLIENTVDLTQLLVAGENK